MAELSFGGGWRMLGLITPMFKVRTFKVEVVVSKLEFLIGGGGGNWVISTAFRASLDNL